jgi:NACalpha-BTF3-like transcription factor
MNSHAQLSAAQQLASSTANPASLEATTASAGADEDEVPELKEVEDDGPVDETGIDPKDIDLVMQQVNCSRAKAVRALRDSGGDLINASECFRSRFYSETDISPSHGRQRVDSFFVSPHSLSTSIQCILFSTGHCKRRFHDHETLQRRSSTK